MPRATPKSDKKAELNREVGARIVAARERRGWNTSELARRLEMSTSRVQHWEYGNAMPKPAEWILLADVLGVSESELLRGSRALARDVQGVAEDPYGLGQHGLVRKVPVISWVAASQFCGSGDPYPTGAAERYEYLVDVGPRCYALAVKGPSMEPRFYERDLIVVDSERQARPGDFVIVARGGSEEATFKQLALVDGKLWLKPLNAQFPAFPFPEDGRVCGVVVKRIESF